MRTGQSAAPDPDPPQWSDGRGTVTGILALGARFSDVNLPAYLAAFGGGVVSFLSPCVLPLLPGYLSMVTGLDLSELQDEPRQHTRRIVTTTAYFVAGFGAVFVALGLSATSIGQLLRDHQTALTRLSGALMLAMALFLLGSLFLRAPWLYQEKRFHPQLGRFGNAAPAVAGVAFGFGWSPCIGPILGSILGIAANQHRVWAGGTLLAVYSLGLGLPFLLSGLALGRVSGALTWVKRHFVWLVGISAVIIGIFGLLLMFDQLSRLSVNLQTWLTNAHLRWLVELG
jgi:cytochrome c-type biogenesis protein